MRLAVLQAMHPPYPHRRRQLAPLRPFDRVVAGYATLAFGLGAGESVALRQWLIAAFATLMTSAGVALLAFDHRRWRLARRRPASR